MTTTALAVVSPSGGDVDALAARLRVLGNDAALGITASRAEVHLPGVVAPRGLGAGALTWECSSERPLADLLAVAAVADALADAEVGAAVELVPIAARHVEAPGPLIKRTLLLRVRAGTPTATVGRFEADLAAMPDHIPTIASWRLSRIADGSSWTHAWEQEYASLDGLAGEYMTNPFHWTTVDAWFDAEVPDHIVEPRLAHLFAVRDVPWSRAELEEELAPSG
jgi:hypothetical protein